MADETRCELTDLLITDCAHCKATDGLATEGAVWSALYPGRCPTCSYTYDVGNRLKWSSTGEPQHAYHS